MKTENIVLSIGVLVSDRIDTIAKCLESLEPIRKSIPSELIITFTGKDPAVRAIAEKYADRIADYEWCGDFSAARNENLRQAAGEWYMYLDDDECFGDTEDLVGFFQSGLYRSCDGACYVQRNYQTKTGELYTDDRVSRMIRRLPESHFESKIHEYLVPIATTTCILKSYVEHYGYIFDTEEERRRHFERNHRLLMEMLEKDPSDQRCLTHLASEYILIRDYDRLRQLGEDSLEKLESLTDEESRINRGTFYLCKIMAYEGQGNNERMLAACEEALSDSRNTSLCLASVHWWRAICLFRTGSYRDAEKDLLLYLKEYPMITGRETEYVIEQLAMLVNQCYDEVRLQDAYGMLGVIGLRRRDSTYLERYLDQFGWVEGKNYIYRPLLEELLGTFARISKESKAMKEAVEEVNLYVRLLHQIQTNRELRIQFWNHIQDWYEEGRTEVGGALEFYDRHGYGEAVIHFLEWKKIDERLKKGGLSRSWQTYKDAFQEYSTHIAIFCEKLYGKDFRESEQQDGKALLALFMESAWKNEDDRTYFVDSMKQCAALAPHLGEAIKIMLILYLEEPERKRREAAREMRRLRLGLIDQARECMEHGRPEQAVEILGQLKNVFPNDLEVAGLCLEVRISMLQNA